MRTAPLACALALIVAAPLAARAQEEALNAPATLSVYVVDQSTRAPLPAAVVEFPELGRSGTTNVDGRAMFLHLAAGTHTATVRMLGFERFTAEVTLEPGRTSTMTIALGPKPIVLEGVTAQGYGFAAELERRRRAVPTSVRVIPRTSLANTGARNAREMVVSHAGLVRASCRGVGIGDCVLIRGRPGRPRVVIDEMPMVGGLDQLAMYTPQELYTVEVLGGGSVIRAYTIHFIERNGRLGTRALFPL